METGDKDVHFSKENRGIKKKAFGSFGSRYKNKFCLENKFVKETSTTGYCPVEIQC